MECWWHIFHLLRWKREHSTYSCFMFTATLGKLSNLSTVDINRIDLWNRLAIPLGLLTAFNAEILPRIGTGPFWHYVISYSNNCKDTWWTNLLFITNFVEPIKQCMGVTWYLAVDTQWFIISPIFLYTLFYYNKNYAGYITLAAGILIVTIIRIALVMAYEYPPSTVMV